MSVPRLGLRYIILPPWLQSCVEDPAVAGRFPSVIVHRADPPDVPEVRDPASSQAPLLLHQIIGL